MKKMICEICNSSRIKKIDDVFVCQECGTEYGLEEAKKLLKEIQSEEDIVFIEKHTSTPNGLINFELLAHLIKYAFIQHAFDVSSEFLLQKRFNSNGTWSVIINELKLHNFPKNIFKPSHISDWEYHFPYLDKNDTNGIVCDFETAMKELEKQPCYKAFRSARDQFQYATNTDYSALGTIKSQNYKNTIRSSDRRFKKYVHEISLPSDIWDWAKEHIKTGVSYNWVATVMKRGFFSNSFSDVILHEFKVQNCVEFIANKIRAMDNLKQIGLNKGVQFLVDNFEESKNTFIKLGEIAEELDKITPMPFNLRNWKHMVYLVNLVNLKCQRNETVSFEDVLLYKQEIVSNSGNTSNFQQLLDIKDKILPEVNQKDQEEIENVTSLFECVFSKKKKCQTMK